MKRPEITPEIIAETAKNIVKLNGWHPSKTADLIECYEINISGFELAKRLESQCNWEISPLDVEALDYMTIGVKFLHKKECRIWAKKYNIKPPLPIGAATNFGVITGISITNPASYEIRENNETVESRRLIVRFEDVHEV